MITYRNSVNDYIPFNVIDYIAKCGIAMKWDEADMRGGNATRSMRDGCKKAFAIFLCAWCALAGAAPAYAESYGGADTGAYSDDGLLGDGLLGDGLESDGVSRGFMRTDGYDNYLAGVPTQSRPRDSYDIPATSFAPADGAAAMKDYRGRPEAALWEEGGAALTWSFNVSREGLYRVELTYFVEAARQESIELAMEVNGESPFGAASRLKLPREWRDDGEIAADGRGNDLRPPVVPREEWITIQLRDYEGLYNDPFLFYFRAGENSLTLKKTDGRIAIAGLRIYNGGEPLTYAEYSAGAVAEVSAPSRVEGERYAYKSSPGILSKFDRSTAATQPSDPKLIRLNTVGQDSWYRQGQYIAWSITVEKAGYYPIGIRFRQNNSRAMTSYRRLYINGEVPFGEADALPFRYASGWQEQYISDERGNPYLFYLEEGVNEIMLEASPGPVGEIIAEMDEMLYVLKTLYRKIVMITGVTPDPLRDYQLEKHIPGIMEEFAGIENSLSASRGKIVAFGKQKGLGDAAAILTTLGIQLEGFVDKPLLLAQRLPSFNLNVSSFADFINALREMPLEIDYIVAGGTVKDGFVKTSVFKRLIYAVKAFIATFTTDYDLIGDVETDGESLEVWINGDPSSGYGRDQTQVISDLVRDSFMAQSDIKVSIKLVQQALVPSILSGAGPDVALYVGDTVVLACRGALADFDRFDGIEDVLERFHPQAAVPLRYKGKLYGLPLTQNFSMMFCRTDILEELGLTPPATWDEFYRLLTVLQRNNLKFGVPNAIPGMTMNSNNSIFAMLLYQMGGTYYNDGLTRTRFDEEVAIKAFEQWTGFYRDYKLDTEYYFFTRFRSGEMPLAIEGYTTYNLLTVAAPELRGLWEMYPVPGHADENGNINNTTIASGSAAVILENSDMKEEAYEFLCWLTSAEAQATYGQQIESLMGGGVRYDTANIEAFKNLPWTSGEQEIILGEWEKITSLPVIPASYALERNLTNAFRNVINPYRNKNPREMLGKYNAEINQEIERKLLEFAW